MKNKLTNQSAPARQPARESFRSRFGEGGFFRPRVLLSLLVCLAAGCFVASDGLQAFFRTDAPSNHPERTITFADRVAYQRAIEEVYWRHRIWPRERTDPKPSLDAAMSQAQLEKKVTDYLRKSQALEDYLERPITADQLQAEMDRMATNTKQPEVLRELFEALGNDPFVIAECLARPVLAQRLATELKNEDRAKLTKVAWLRDSLQSEIATSETQAPKKVVVIESIAKAVQLNRPYQLPVIASPSGGCIDDTWT